MLDANLQLMNEQTLTASGDSATVLDMGEGFAPQPDQAARLNLIVSALDLASTNETYVADVQESDAAGSGFASTGLKLTITAVGALSKLFSLTKRYVKLAWTLGGTTPSVTASAWIGPR
jgi:hypothetical protein